MAPWILAYANNRYRVPIWVERRVLLFSVFSAVVLAIVGLLPAVAPSLAVSGAFEAQPDCLREACDVALTKMATLRGSGAAGSLHGSAPVYVVRDDRGRFLVPTADRRRVAVFSSSGTVISVLNIVRGADRAVLLWAAPGGSTLAWSFPSGRASAIGGDLAVRDWPVVLPYLPGYIRADGSVVVAQQIQTPDLIGYPLHLVSPTGRVIRSFGIDTPEYRADLRLLLDRVVTPASDGQVWAAPLGRYVIERWDPEKGTRLLRTPIRSDWFVESANFPSDNMTRPKPIILALWEINGLVLTLIQDADAAWKPSTESERLLDPKLRNAKYDSVLEIIDPASGRVVASQRFPFVLFGRAPQPLLASHAFSKDGEPLGLNVWKPELRRKEKK